MVPQISVVIPLHNGAKYVEAALNSIHNQTVQVAEILVIDDGSTDNGAELARQHPSRPIVFQQPNQGAAAARNCGIRKARFPFIAFLDHDDLWRPNKLLLQCAAFEQDPDLVTCFGRIDFFWEDPNCIEAKAFKGHHRTTAVPGYVTTTMLARASVFETVGMLDESLAQADSIKWCAALQDLGVKSRMLDAVLLDHRMHETNLTRRRENFASEILSVLRRRQQTRRPATDE